MGSGPDQNTTERCRDYNVLGATDAWLSLLRVSRQGAPYVQPVPHAAVVSIQSDSGKTTQLKFSLQKGKVVEAKIITDIITLYQLLRKRNCTHHASMELLVALLSASKEEA